MTTTIAPNRTAQNPLTAGQLAPWAPWALLGVSVLIGAAIAGLIAGASDSDFSVVIVALFGFVLYLVSVTVVSQLIEGGRKAADRLVTGLVVGAFLLALIPLISLIVTVVVNGAARFDLQFFTWTMRNVVGEGGGVLHAIVGTVLVTLWAAIISVPVGIFTAIYLVEYGRGALSKAITFFVDVMTGIPSIVAGLFAYALFALFAGEGVRSGLGGAVALSLLMIPTVVRSTEEMLKLVPNDLREASLALGVPKWLTIWKVVLPTALAGIVTGVTLAVARVIGETAPLLIIAGFTTNMNYNVFDGRMMTLPVFAYNQYISPGVQEQAYFDRAWSAALVLILIVMILNIGARVIAHFFAPKSGR
ncbi:phosphate ABC transporter membrane protein 2, PhoT family [Agrococcus baldri]|uniref:Phosphate transport system permease protein PstA n=1 Tax=Agrococcus baldri TaxID=153730 RepID=A0AA94KYR0_9MICO|nr:phosphate ABC transporter permease PstA [Agrococcus baldri]SFS01463.1 phosphate ABC transporter membrane protein 2, PhoT family [Agrococcus baldri]